eukprot:TRINITY_DN2927_c0_g1_i2.p1 TRINITY_DN2927_c0_g1~~TRINITY_DN2927_c0_g1_i2.p1  ORF type:complete len:412 (-),score=107.00 TRINITY_DN2927_c0_g1_i2:776-2011(-)
MNIIGIYLDGFVADKRVPIRIHFCSNTDPESFSVVQSRIAVETTIMVNMSKSGGTAETKGNMEAWAEICNANNLIVGKHNIAITTKGSYLDGLAKETGYLFVYHMETETGGRTSVGTAIGMVPAAFAGMDFEQFLRGQSHMDSMTRRPNAKENPAMILALGIDNMTRIVGNKNMVYLCYSDFLKEFANYLQQLFMESLGKGYTRECQQVPYGLTVFGGVGTSSQHSFVQQLVKGIKDCFIRFINFGERGVDFHNNAAGSMGRQLLAFFLGTQKAMDNNGVPFFSTTFAERNEFNLGMMIALEERLVTILANMHNINAFDQPGVQDGKLACDEINVLSKAIEEHLSVSEIKLGFTMKDVNFTNIIMTKRQCLYVFLDIARNQRLPNAYPLLFNHEKTLTFDFINGEFVFNWQ